MEKLVEKERVGAEAKLFNFRPMFFSAIFLILGILFYYFRRFYDISAWWLIVFAPVVLVTMLFSRGKKNALQRGISLFVLAIFFALGALVFRAQLADFVDCPSYSGEVVVTGTVEDRRDLEGTFAVRLRSVTVNGEEAAGTLNAYLPPSFGKKTGIGDQLVLLGEIRVDTRLTNSYGFRESAIREKNRYVFYADDGSNVGKTKDWDLRIRARVEEVVYAGMDETPAGLTLALLTGDAWGIDEDLDENMRNGGISHIFAVSGLNVGALFAVCLFLFSRPPLWTTPKIFRFLLLVGILSLYSAICGFTASVVRAALMCIVAYAARLFGEGSDLLESLGISAILLLLWRPSEVFGVGFQLSYLACVGLALWTKPIEQVFDQGAKVIKKRFPRRYTAEELEALESGDTLPPTFWERLYFAIRTLVAASIAAQLATLPALLIHFDYVSGWALLLNLFFVPFTDGIFTLLLALVALACVLPIAVSKVLLYFPSLAWSAAILIFDVADFSTFALSGVKITFGICVCYYWGLTFLSDKWNLTKKRRRGLAIFLFSVGAIALHLLAVSS